MQTTNKKFINKKNIPENKAQKLKNTFQKTETSKSSHENQGETKENIFSDPYQAEDQYADLQQKFERGIYDIGYQVFENAFPFRKQNKKEEKTFVSDTWEGFEDFEVEFKAKPNRELKLMKGSDFNELREVEEIIYPYAESSDSEEDEEESTKENSNDLQNREA